MDVLAIDSSSSISSELFEQGDDVVEEADCDTWLIRLRLLLVDGVSIGAEGSKVEVDGTLCVMIVVIGLRECGCVRIFDASV